MDIDDDVPKVPLGIVEHLVDVRPHVPSLRRPENFSVLALSCGFPTDGMLTGNPVPVIWAMPTANHRHFLLLAP